MLANDGNGTNILTAAIPSSLTIQGAESIPTPEPSISETVQENSQYLAFITSSSHPDQTKWYNLSHVILDWTNDQGVSQVKLGYDKNADGSPSVLYQDPVSHKELDLNDGIWYFHVREKGSDGWGDVATYRIQIDTISPQKINLQFPSGKTSQDGTLPIQFSTTDGLSGIDHYELAVDGKKKQVSTGEGNGVYSLSVDSGGNHTLIVTAFDKAGNTISAQDTFEALRGNISPFEKFFSLGWLAVNYLSIGLLVILGIAALIYLVWYLWHHFHKFRRRYPGALNIDALVHEKFSILRRAMVKEMRTLEKVQDKRELTSEEMRVLKNLEKLLDKMEDSLEKDIAKEIQISLRSGRM